jgi:hypothetical protein
VQQLPWLKVLTILCGISLDGESHYSVEGGVGMKASAVIVERELASQDGGSPLNIDGEVYTPLTRSILVQVHSSLLRMHTLPPIVLKYSATNPPSPWSLRTGVSNAIVSGLNWLVGSPRYRLDKPSVHVV